MRAATPGSHPYLPAIENQENHMKSIILALTAAALIATPTFARQLKHPPRAAAAAASLATARSLPAVTSYSGPDPYGVYINGEMIGRDPDPNVRQELVYDYVATHRW